MHDSRLVEEITEQIVARLSPEKLWEMALSCQAVCVEKDAEQVRLILQCGAERISLSSTHPVVRSELASYIDHTLLRADASQREIDQLCREAAEYGFASVCVNPYWVPLAARILAGESSKVCTVVGFPLGATAADIKAYEARRAIFDGAVEVDMVINVGALKSGMDEVVERDVAAVVDVCHGMGAITKVILETALLTDEEKVKACTLCREAGADFVKTSTGFGPGGATAEDVALMRRVVGPRIGVKASGGIRDSEQTRKMIEAGATRIGASAGVKIIQNQSTAAGSQAY